MHALPVGELPYLVDELVAGGDKDMVAARRPVTVHFLRLGHQPDHRGSGRFDQLGEHLADTAAAAGVHYSDVTGPDLVALGHEVVGGHALCKDSGGGEWVVVAGQ
jgi:hypothetical protein